MPSSRPRPPPRPPPSEPHQEGNPDPRPEQHSSGDSAVSAPIISAPGLCICPSPCLPPLSGPDLVISPRSVVCFQGRIGAGEGARGGRVPGAGAHQPQPRPQHHLPLLRHCSPNHGGGGGGAPAAAGELGEARPRRRLGVPLPRRSCRPAPVLRIGLSLLNNASARSRLASVRTSCRSSS
uniref:Predicted protein n=1 Tax=Hordeum vulgare subsp. vulgare TaxID=112509 RepID=F2D7A6_HORVV|nr:predicted protein [Hordeum vulgare subsp. vulgare]